MWKLLVVSCLAVANASILPYSTTHLIGAAPAAGPVLQSFAQAPAQVQVVQHRTLGLNSGLRLVNGLHHGVGVASASLPLATGYAAAASPIATGYATASAPAFATTGFASAGAPIAGVASSAVPIAGGSAFGYNYGLNGLAVTRNVLVKNDALEVPTSLNYGPLVSKEFTFHSAPTELEEPQHKIIDLGPSQKKYRVIFIKAPTVQSAHTRISVVKPQDEEKTVVYVLTKKQEHGSVDADVHTAPAEPTKPEVFFIKYKTPEEAAAAQQEIQAQFEDALGGSSQVSDEGVSPIASVVGSGDIVAQKTTLVGSAVAPATVVSSGQLVGNGPALLGNGPALLSSGPSFVASGPSFAASGPSFVASAPAAVGVGVARHTIVSPAPVLEAVNTVTHVEKKIVEGPTFVSEPLGSYSETISDKYLPAQK